jgi:small subunit ribosomal protein S17
MKVAEIRKMSVAQIEEEMIGYPPRIAEPQVSNDHRPVDGYQPYPIIRRDIARMETILREKQLAEMAEESESMNKRRRLVGTVVSNKMQKTAVVEVERVFRHPLYHKVVRSAKAYKAHDELGASVGDRVRIVESKPISRTKYWVVEEILRVEERSEDDTVEELGV